MRKYLFLIRGQEGCDYSIACGITYEEIEANNVIEAYRKVQEDYGISYDFKRYDENILDIKCYDITDSEYTSFDNLKKNLEEYNEYLRLKEKFDKES